MEASLTVKGRQNGRKLSLGGKCRLKKTKKKLKMVNYSENQHFKTVGLPPNLKFVPKNSPATVKTIYLPAL